MKPSRPLTKGLLHKGDRVKLTKKAIGAVTIYRGKKYVNWKMRTGTVEYSNAYTAQVRWDGRKSMDPWPVKALQLL